MSVRHRSRGMQIVQDVRTPQPPENRRLPITRCRFELPDSGMQLLDRLLQLLCAASALHGVLAVVRRPRRAKTLYAHRFTPIAFPRAKTTYRQFMQAFPRGRLLRGVCDRLDEKKLVMGEGRLTQRTGAFGMVAQAGHQKDSATFFIDLEYKTQTLPELIATRKFPGWRLTRPDAVRRRKCAISPLSSPARTVGDAPLNRPPSDGTASIPSATHPSAYDLMTEQHVAVTTASRHPVNGLGSESYSFLDFDCRWHRASHPGREDGPLICGSDAIGQPIRVRIENLQVERLRMLDVAGVAQTAKLDLCRVRHFMTKTTGIASGLVWIQIVHARSSVGE
ncbi:hypothetical protein GGX14DRAFT_392785 [Mycena pura]|uniref:Uncharacterized protein n=1 Tax=Mycena pura TaxID=153505 RepID=A0AAD6VR95_9AGAR|nr:hypothetical protein GGX14DRAFT_392785 [Mycena pura]